MEIDNKLIELGLIPLIDASKLLNYSNESYANMRHVGFGASEASILLGINPFNTIEDLRKQKIELAYDPEISKKDVVRKGRDLENIFMDKASKHFNIDIYKPDYMYEINPEARLTVNFDGVTEIDSQLIPVEIKMCSIYGAKHYNFDRSLEENIAIEHWTTELVKFKTVFLSDSLETCGFPSYYYAQLQQQMYALNAPFGILAVMDDKTWRMHYFITKRNESMINDLILKAIKNKDCLHSKEEILNSIPQDLLIQAKID